MGLASVLRLHPLQGSFLCDAHATAFSPVVTDFEPSFGVLGDRGKCLPSLDWYVVEEGLGVWLRSRNQVLSADAVDDRVDDVVVDELSVKAPVCFVSVLLVKF